MNNKMHRNLAMLAFTLLGNACQPHNDANADKSGLSTVQIGSLQSDAFDQYSFGMTPKAANGTLIREKVYAKGEQTIEATVVPGEYQIKLDYLKNGSTIISADFCAAPKPEEDNVRVLKVGKNILKIAVCTKDGQAATSDVQIIPVLIPMDADKPAETSSLVNACTKTFLFQGLDAEAATTFKGYFSDPTSLVRDVAIKVCTRLYKNASEVPGKAKVTLTLKKTASANDVAFTSGSADFAEITINSEYIKKFKLAHSDDETKNEVLGVITHEMTHVFQKSTPNTNMGWLIEGLADFVRLREGLVDINKRRKGGNFTDAYNTTAFFLDYLDRTYPDFAYKVNLAADKWPANNQAFVQITSKDVDTLWKEYQASF